MLFLKGFKWLESMNSKDILYSKGKNDECNTPKYGVLPILKYIPKGAVVWCPFDKVDSEFVIEISKINKVIFSHIESGQDFYNYEPEEHWDMIVSNPPFTAKKLIFQRALSFNKPFALIMSNTWLNDSAPVKLFKDVNFQLLLFDKRIKYKNKMNGANETNENDKITFSSGYFCRDFLPKQIIMEELYMGEELNVN